MVTLHAVTQATKKLLVGLAIGIASIIFIIVTTRLIIRVKEIIAPTPLPPPTVSFGKLPSVQFPSETQPTYTYTLNTLTGDVPDFPDRATVYKINQPQPSLLNFDTATSLASKNGFTNPPTQLSDTEYVWEQTTGLNQKLDADIVSFNFSLTTPDYLTNQQVIAANTVPSDQDALNLATNFFQGFSSYPDDIDTTKTAITFYSILNNSLSLAKKATDVQIATVDFYQKDINNLPILYPNYPTSVMHAVIGSQDNGLKVLEANYYHQDIATDTSATYPIITGKQALQLLKENKAYIAHNDSTNTAVTIRQVFLAYYLGKDPQQYLYPIIVFQGDNNFYAYVSAVRDEWIGK